MVYADRDRIYALPTNGSPPFALSLYDGTSIEVDSLTELTADAVSLRNGVVTRIENLPSLQLLGLSTPKCRISGVDLETRETLWKSVVSRQTRLAMQDEHHLTLLTPQGELSSLDIRTGTVQRLGEVPSELSRDPAPIQMLHDVRGVYLFCTRNASRNAPLPQLAHLSINGDVLCFALDGSGLKWGRKAEEQQLLTARFQHSPVMLMVHEREDSDFHRLSVEMWDKQTGQLLLDAADIPMSSPVYQLEVDLADRRFRLMGHNLELEITPATARDVSAPQDDAAQSPPTATPPRP